MAIGVGWPHLNLAYPLLAYCLTHRWVDFKLNLLALAQIGQRLWQRTNS